MKKFILAGCDLHDQTLCVCACVGSGPAQTRTFANSESGLLRLEQWLRALAPRVQIVFAYEASGLGFGLYERLCASGMRCHVLAPSRLSSSPKQRKNKTDEQDALKILDALRAHYLAGAALPAIWIPDAATRDAREIVRARLDTQHKCTRLKTQIRTLLKRNGAPKPAGIGSDWTCAYKDWLKALSACDEPLQVGARIHLASLLRQLAHLEEELELLDTELKRLSRSERYAEPVRKLTRLTGVGVLTALVFLTELGDLKRFHNRRQIASYVGLVPSASESGARDNRKGQITRQGPARVRQILCQAAWVCVIHDAEERKIHERLVRKNPQHRKKALVAVMRRLAIRMWHAAVA